MSSPLLSIQTLEYERDLYDSGISSIAGVDEVGRGALAGPLVSAAVILPRIEILTEDADFWANVRDSKTLSAKKRETLASGIVERAICWSVHAIESTEIDEIGVGPANRVAMERAVLGLDREPEVLLIDAMTIDSSTWQIGVIDGDALSLSIAAASIVAKVARDTLMIEAGSRWPAYGFPQHKGYGVRTHIAALQEHGPCEIHRRCFSPVRLAQEALDARQKA
ncbi:MAG TPA: ribonuclease HII [Thermomicrobiales bacterium]|nr:ribonuclease HII [Thermomicrobiales bacterium]